jgi:hypothetical protein
LRAGGSIRSTTAAQFWPTKLTGYVRGRVKIISSST